MSLSFPLMVRRGGAALLGRNATASSLAFGVTTSLLTAAAAARTTTATTSSVVSCAAGSDDDSSSSFWSRVTSTASETTTKTASTVDTYAEQLGSTVQSAIDSGIPTQLSYGFVSGYCSGLALKKAGRAAGVVFGMGFVILQTLQYSGYIQVDHGKLKKDVESMFDLDKDGDFDKDDAKLMYNKLMAILEFNMPAGGGFGAGFIGGLRSG